MFADVDTTLRTLRSQGFVLGLCSNWDWDLERHLHDNEINELFDFVICSASLGYRKPHRSVFEKVIDGRRENGPDRLCRRQLA